MTVNELNMIADKVRTLFALKTELAGVGGRTDAEINALVAQYLVDNPQDTTLTDAQVNSIIEAYFVANPPTDQVRTDAEINALITTYIQNHQELITTDQDIIDIHNQEASAADALTQEQVDAIIDGQGGGGGGATSVIIDDNTTYASLSAIGSNSSMAESSFEIDATKGISFGNNTCGNSWCRETIDFDIPAGAVSLTIIFSGDYINGLGTFGVSGNPSTHSYISLGDAWASDGQGQSLYIDEVTIFDQSGQAVLNREETIPLQAGDTTITVNMGGLDGYGYTRRYIKSLVFNS